jgi:hypothetical protein
MRGEIDERFVAEGCFLRGAGGTEERVLLERLEGEASEVPPADAVPAAARAIAECCCAVSLSFQTRGDAGGFLAREPHQRHGRRRNHGSTELVHTRQEMETVSWRRCYAHRISAKEICR